MKKFKCRTPHCGGGCKFESVDWIEKLNEICPNADWYELAEETDSFELPDWCKVGAIGYCTDCGYFEVIDTQADMVTVRAISSDAIHSYTEVDARFFKEARNRPFNAEEMKALIGKIAAFKNEEYRIIEACNMNQAMVYMCGAWYNGLELMNYNYKVDGKPCYVLEHLNEKGEWVK